MTNKKEFPMTGKSLDHPEVQALLKGNKQREDTTATFLAMCNLLLTPEERMDAAQFGRDQHKAAMAKLAKKKDKMP